MTRTLLATLVAVGTILLLAARGAAAQAPHAEDPAAEHGKASPHGSAGGDDAAPHDAAAGPARGGTHADGHDAGPVPPGDHSAVWPGLVLILILTMFVLAAVIGPIARMHAPPAEMPVTHSHDEPPGASHHHGSGGTINPEPDHHGGAHGRH